MWTSIGLTPRTDRDSFTRELKRFVAGGMNVDGVKPRSRDADVPEKPRRLGVSRSTRLAECRLVSGVNVDLELRQKKPCRFGAAVATHYTEHPRISCVDVELITLQKQSHSVGVGARANCFEGRENVPVVVNQRLNQVNVPRCGCGRLHGGRNSTAHHPSLSNKKKVTGWANPFVRHELQNGGVTSLSRFCFNVAVGSGACRAAGASPLNVVDALLPLLTRAERHRFPRSDVPQIPGPPRHPGPCIRAVPRRPVLRRGVGHLPLHPRPDSAAVQRQAPPETNPVARPALWGRRDSTLQTIASDVALVQWAFNA